MHLTVVCSSDAMILNVSVRMQLGLSYSVPRELLYSDIGACIALKEPCVSDLVELLRHVRLFPVAEASIEQHIPPHVVLRGWHTSNRLAGLQKQVRNRCMS
jgi:hypothetical protein